MHSLPYGRLFSVNAACRIDALQWFGLLCGIVGLLFLFCMRLFGFAALCESFAMCVLCCDCWLCFSLCQRIFNCGLRSFALARATSPCQSPRAGPQRFFFWVRVCGCCSPEHKKQKENHKSSALHNQNAKYPLRGRITISLNNRKATVYRAVSRKTRGGSPLGAVHLNIKSKMNRTKSVRFTNKTLK